MSISIPLHAHKSLLPHQPPTASNRPPQHSPGLWDHLGLFWAWVCLGMPLLIRHATRIASSLEGTTHSDGGNGGVLTQVGRKGGCITIKGLDRGKYSY